MPCKCFRAICESTLVNCRAPFNHNRLRSSPPARNPVIGWYTETFSTEEAVKPGWEFHRGMPDSAKMGVKCAYD